MSEIKVVKKIIKVHVENETFDVRKPTAKEVSDYAKKEDNSLDALIDFLDQLGLPKEKAWQLDFESLQEVSKAALPQVEKKS